MTNPPAPSLARQHWIVELAKRANLPNADRLGRPAGTHIRETWGVVCRTCNLEPGELALRVAEHFRLPTATVESLEPQSLKLARTTLAVNVARGAPILQASARERREKVRGSARA